MDCKYFMYQVFLLSGELSKKKGWDGNIDTLKENSINKLVILNRELEPTYYQHGKDQNERYRIFYPAQPKDITSFSYIHSVSQFAEYRLDIQEFINYSDNKNRFYRNKKTGICYFRAEPEHTLKNQAWITARMNDISNGYLICCDNLNDFGPLFSEGGTKKSSRRSKKLRSRRKSRRMYS